MQIFRFLLIVSGRDRRVILSGIHHTLSLAYANASLIRFSRI